MMLAFILPADVLRLEFFAGRVDGLGDVLVNHGLVIGLIEIPEIGIYPHLFFLVCRLLNLIAAAASAHISYLS